MLRTYAVGAQFAGYRIDALLGQGGMGQVYRAENPRLGTWLALKILAPELAGNERFRERFVRESRAAASLDHPNVIPIFDADEEDGVPYIAMRYIEGRDLKTILEQEGRLSVERTLELLRPVADALDLAHSKGVVHRDVKPANILVERRARADHVYLSDFGVAKLAIARGLTSTGEFVGTIEYVAPEQIEGKPVDGRADVYALGCIAYECLSGTAPYDRDSTVSLMYAHLQDPPPVLSETRPDLTAGLSEVIKRALAKSPDDRYPTAGELVAAVESPPDPSAAPPPRAPETVIRKRPRAAETVVRRKPWTKAAEPSEAPVPAAVVRAPSSETVLSSRPESASSKVGSRRALLVVGPILALALAAGGAYALLGMGTETRKEPTAKAGVGGGGGGGGGSVDPTPVPPPVAVEPPPPPAVRCRIGNVRGLTLAAARRRLEFGHCALGTTTPAYSGTTAKGHVVSQSPGAGVSLRSGGKVHLIVSRGQRPAPVPPPSEPPPDGGPPPPNPPPPGDCVDRIRCEPPPPPPCDRIRGCR